MKSHSIPFVLLFFMLFTTVSAQSSKELDPGYYIVVNAYAQSKEHIAKIYQDKLNAEGLQAEYGFDSRRNYYYVYLEYFDQYKPSIDRMLEVRNEGRFTDAWVRVIPGDIQVKTEPVVIEEEQPADQEPAPEVVEEAESETEEEEDKIAILIYPPPVEEEVEEVEAPVVEETKVVNLGNTEVFLNLFNPTNNRIVEGEILVIDTERSKLLGKVNGNEEIYLPDPNTSSGELTLISEAFGYRKMQHSINYITPLADTIEPYIEYVDNTILVNFDLIKYRKGDITILYNVYFYNDAALMLPESKYELNNLVSMMLENPDYKIRLHGHTNGKYYGRILDLGPEKEFFEITPDAEESNGSARNLSRKRAETIKEYLIMNGIPDDRVEIKAWGGKKPLFNKLGPDATQNVRVEVEILSD
jgi:outer membrane protein OmpA-like peptidoglycan-associated protein